MTQSFEQKVKSMSGYEIVMAMVRGLEKEHVKIHMTSFGRTDGSVCYGCAATNAICEISGIVFTPQKVRTLSDRASFVKTDMMLLDQFEDAIDGLRQGDIEEYNYCAKIIDITQLPYVDTLPILRTDTYKENLHHYITYANSIK